MSFRFLNVPVYIHPTFWLLLMLFTDVFRGITMEGVIVGAVMTISLLVHEYGHALTAMFFGGRPTIIMEALGGRAEYDGRGITAKQKFLITLNGPLLEALLIPLSYGMLHWGVFEGMYYVQYFLYVMMRLNIVWCLLNLIPIAPLDGGYLVRYLLESKFGDKGHKASIILGLICVVLAAPYLFYEGFYIFGTLLLVYGYMNFKTLQELRIAAEGYNPFNGYTKGMDAIKKGEPEKAKIAFRKVLKCEDPGLRHLAIEALAKVYAEDKEREKSYDLLSKADPQLLKEGKCLLCKLAFEQKDYEVISKYSREIYDIEPTHEIALLNSRAFACLKESSLAGAWLRTASEFGPEYGEEIKKAVSDHSYDLVREENDFKEYTSKLGL